MDERQVTGAMVEEMRGPIRRLFDKDRLEATTTLVRTYFTDPQYAGATFNAIGVNDPYSIGADDLLAVHMLSVPISPALARATLEDDRGRREIVRLLCGIDPELRLWDDGADASLRAANDLWDILDRVRGVGSVIAGKLLARKRPHLIPIADDLVWDYLKPEKGLFWGTLRQVLQDADLRDRIEGLRPESLDSVEMRDKISTLRLLDVAIWMNAKYPGGTQQRD